jgi:hypothetical protein
VVASLLNTIGKVKSGARNISDNLLSERSIMKILGAWLKPQQGKPV